MSILASSALNRRGFLTAAGAAGLGALSGVGTLFAQGAAPIDFRTRLTRYQFADRPMTQDLVSLVDNAPPPVLRLKRNEKAVIHLTNGLEDYTTIHWHGLRIDNRMDGVPYLTQIPVGQNETFAYEYTPPDAGTFWYHPHCMTMQQMAHGLTGMLIVEEDDDPGFDADVPVNMKDFRLQDDGTFLPYFTARGAARGGTLGNVRTVNWDITPSYNVPAGGLVRLRLLNTDLARVYKIYLPEVTGEVIAWNGNPLREPLPMPTQDAPLWVAPGERVDIALRAPDRDGAEIPVQTRIGGQISNIVTLRAAGASLNRDLAELRPLPPADLPEPDLANAQVEEILFGWSPDGDGTKNGFCGDFGYTFWSIDRKPWPGDDVPGTGPVTTLRQGQSYILRLRNESPNLHPIHLHGLVFRPISSNLRTLPSNWTDTMLLLKGEIIDVALVADNPGDWAFHCHVIEHQKSGLAGYIRVS
ncbi:MAG: multicopper oxidase family protein [Pseudomonadota bacterium]